ncbi:DNA mismatch repair protein msh6 [Ancistrocladus abbreviatus]
MFSTHYHRLAVDYRTDPKVSLCHMACQVGKGADGVEEVTFLYRLTNGACPKSYGVNVARLAGVPDSVLLKASAKSREFEAAYGRKRKLRLDELEAWKAEVLAFIQNVIKVVTDLSSLKLKQKVDIALFCELQCRARMILQQN